MQSNRVTQKPREQSHSQCCRGTRFTAPSPQKRQIIDTSMDVNRYYVHSGWKSVTVTLTFCTLPIPTTSILCRALLHIHYPGVLHAGCFSAVRTRGAKKNGNQFRHLANIQQEASGEMKKFSFHLGALCSGGHGCVCPTWLIIQLLSIFVFAKYNTRGNIDPLKMRMEMVD